MLSRLTPPTTTFKSFFGHTNTNTKISKWNCYMIKDKFNIKNKLEVAARYGYPFREYSLGGDEDDEDSPRFKSDGGSYND
ncbi:hypothetical protein PHYBLDRAFT_183888 [Phycomyces blakesleeanus NRRL 1555(-)]|uniref:Uncharacterized protein n=1 Tax=Phycomyces blakesleeanus (strain ATCC 8743b / DSM 1359 / FGSC 10004 / NBRC 33097 / NRRL 1555) TaxID=763407 RepID=A0A162TEE9_PHYB8|nr:hypothetical protein PHYBLDRAFT_183888 [Phycomyces blakesleeanus NRRL 1555(-)]OAD66483.1 hypothetical protein PHYBLDRAFT_183888 [Phycomyces blakesleeanus NRRL 1555(-)]|eukprot:XP_018284523.1 hypothetical protein PHYBLDRAFT_183888 [Phycomyces blakesleeanus NRRL 1555(-)]